MGCRSFRFLIAIGSCATTAGCFPPPALVIQVNEYPDFERAPVIRICTPAESERSVEIFDADRPTPEGCQQRGDIFIGDSGSTSKCKPKNLMTELRQAACARGISRTQIIHLTPPRGGSTCHQLRAALLSCVEKSTSPVMGDAN